MRVLGILLFVSAFSDLGSYILIKNGISSMPLVNIYTVAEFFLLGYIYHFLLKKKKKIYISSILFIAFFIIDTLFIQPITEFQSWPLVLESLIVLIYSISFYRQLLKTRIDFLRFFPFWINTAIYFYFAFDLFLFAITNYIIKNMPTDVAMISYSFHNINNTIKNILFAVAICYVGVKQEEYKEAKF